MEVTSGFKNQINLKKILIIRFSSIGDIVLTTPVIRCIKEQKPEIEIHYLTKKSFKGILENNPYLTKIHILEKNVKDVISELKKEKFDFVIDLHNNLRSSRIKINLGKPSSSFKKLNFKKWILVNFKINKMPALHIVDRYMQTVEKLGINNDNKGLDYFIPEKDEIQITSLPSVHQKGYIGFVIGAKHFTKQLPTEKIISICKKINQPIILLGGKEDIAKAYEIEKAIGTNIYNACGKYNLNQSASLIKHAKKIITHDTGLMHIAAAFKKEIISVWGNTVPAFGFTPYLADLNSKMVEVKNLSCRPCSKIGYDKCPKGHFKCMVDIDENLF
ncbi:MAG: glycosyl transferase [Bacteroidetes bacterium RIFCSPLOWO2_12_FULL_35_15]|nr:MAG: glycosyl transferase [Bacteroidetes bacterium RIFCSPLOWO2_12_FULL_35_15]